MITRATREARATRFYVVTVEGIYSGALHKRDVQAVDSTDAVARVLADFGDMFRVVQVRRRWPRVA